MAKRPSQTAQVPSEPEAFDQSGAADTQKPDEKLKFAQEKLARMESTQKLCFRHQNDLPRLEAELKALNCYRDYEITQILEPKGPRNIPGYLKSEIERQKQYVNYLSARVPSTASSHVGGIEEERQSVDELAR